MEKKKNDILKKVLESIFAIIGWEIGKLLF